MKEKSFSKEENNLSEKESSSEVSSGTDGSFFDQEDVNLIENKELDNRRNIINGSLSFINKFEFMKKTNLFYNLYVDNISFVLITNIISLLILLIIILVKSVYLFLSINKLPDYFMLAIIISLIPFLTSTLSKIIMLYNDFKNNDKENENRDLMRLLIQKWNIYYSISLFLLSLNSILKLIVIDRYNYRHKIILIIVILIILLSLIILGIIYYFTKSSDNNILIINLMDKISFPLSISILLSFEIINFVEQFNDLIYINNIFCFLLSCLSLVLMVYFNDILFSLLVMLYQMGGIKNISFHNMSFQLFCTLINMGFIIFMSIKNLRSGFCYQNNDNNYTLIDDQFQDNSEETND
jgi:hypothetical protein